jgi:HPt (histidine-containing phosphotransfer) domain-containing protein
MSQSAEPEIFNREELLRRMMGDRDLAVEIISEFVVDLYSQISGLEQSISSGDMDIIARQIHTLKGAAGNVGAKRLERLAREAERKGVAKDLEQANEFISDLVYQSNVLKNELERLGFL